VVNDVKRRGVRWRMRGKRRENEEEKEERR
jgi:hypothetical protein